MLETSTNATVHNALRKAHYERSRALHEAWAWLFSSRGR
jgi:hypothetical protein